MTFTQRVARPTLSEVADAAGVDKSTASRALRNNPAISPETRERIQKIATLMRYVPNANARRLSESETRVIAFHTKALGNVTDPANPFLLELIAAISREAVIAKYDLLLCCPQDGEDESDTFDRILGGHHADGIILMDMCFNDPRLDYLCAHKYPHVLFGRSDEDMRRAKRYPYPWVEVDNRNGSRVGVEYLLAQQHQRIAFIGGDNIYICDRDRHAGFMDALQAANIPCTDYIHFSAVTENAGYQLTHQVLALSQPPTAIFAFSDVMAVGAMRALQEHHLEVGKDIALMGFDGLGLASYLTPALTTLSQPFREVGQHLVQCLVAQLANTPMPEPHVLLQPNFIIRASTQNQHGSVG